jgi:dihydrofolate reductase
MGGQEIYRIFWPFCNTLHISRIDMLVDDGDAFFPFSWNDVELEFSPVSFVDRSSGGIQWKEYTYERNQH